MNKQKGQALIEFTLVLPFFLLLIFSLIYTGMLFHDYSTLSTIARTAARDRAITSSSSVDDNDIIDRYYDSANGKFKYALVTDLYKPGGAESTDPAMAIETKSDGDIVVTINMRLTDETSPLMEMVLPDKYSIVYHMHKDYN